MANPFTFARFRNSNAPASFYRLNFTLGGQTMATERVTERSDGVTTERVVESTPSSGHTTVVERSGGSGAGLLIALAVIAALAIGAWFLMNASRNDAIQTEAVSDAASSVAGSVDSAADAVAGAATQAADSASPPPAQK